MKCGACNTKNDSHSKYCKECGQELKSNPEYSQPVKNSELYGKEVEVLFYLDKSIGKISGFVNPTEDQINRYKKDSILQVVTVLAPGDVTADENAGTILSFIRQSKEFLGEDYDESYYRKYSGMELKKEYLRLFERVLAIKAKRETK
jgi:hypothetical protein